MVGPPLLYVLLTGVLHGVSWGSRTSGTRASWTNGSSGCDRAYRRAHRISVHGLIVGTFGLQVALGLDRFVTLDRRAILAATFGASLLVMLMPAYVLGWTQDATDPDEVPARGGNGAR